MVSLKVKCLVCRGQRPAARIFQGVPKESKSCFLKLGLLLVFSLDWPENVFCFQSKASGLKESFFPPEADVIFGEKLVLKDAKNSSFMFPEDPIKLPRL